MPKQVVAEQVDSEVKQEVHPLQKSYMFVSKKHVDYNKLTAFEAASMGVVGVLAILVGVLQTTKIV